MRRDPLNVRGPQPGTLKARPAEQKPCDCPKAPIAPTLLSGHTEGARLWKHIGIGTGTCISMIEQYADVGMPGVDLGALRNFRDRLDKVINGNSNPEKRPDDEDRFDDGDGGDPDDAGGSRVPVGGPPDPRLPYAYADLP